MGIDWASGTGSVGKPAETELRIVVASDWAPIRGFAEQLVDAPEEIYGDLLPGLRHADLRIVNLECPLTTRDAPVRKDGPNLRGSPAAIAGLTCVPFDLVCLANNHSMDHGAAGLGDTLELVRGAGMHTVGAGLSPDEALAPVLMQAGSLMVGVLNLCEGEDGAGAVDGPGVFGWEIERAAAEIARLSAHVDAVLVVAHAGREYTPLPPPYLVRAYRRLAEAGASAVIGHHPHVPQGFEIHGRCPIFYSLGNFCFDQAVDLYYRRTGYLVELGLSRGAVRFHIVPYRIGPQGLQEMTGLARERFLDRLRAASIPLNSEEEVRAAWQAWIDRSGEDGLLVEMDRLIGERPVSAERWAKLRNRFLTPAHRNLWIDASTRLVEGRMGTAPAWAQALVEEWSVRPIEPREPSSASRVQP